MPNLAAYENLEKARQTTALLERDIKNAYLEAVKTGQHLLVLALEPMLSEVPALESRLSRIQIALERENPSLVQI